MEPEGSLPCSQKPTTSTYPEPDKWTAAPLYFLKIRFSVIFQFPPFAF
jgi:hypothetical protein